MPLKLVDARGRPCPEPVIETRRALEDPAIDAIEVRVDDQAAAENVARMGRSLGCEVRLEDMEQGGLRVLLWRATGAAPDPVPAGAVAARRRPPSRIAVFLAADGIGRGDDDLGRALMISFIKTLKDLAPRPTSLLLMNSGVKLASVGSPAAGAILELQDLGVEALVCGTCLDFFGLEQALVAGRVSNMFEIASRLVDADRVVRP
jgi:selenium metabolism protein YedF